LQLSFGHDAVCFWTVKSGEFDHPAADPRHWLLDLGIVFCTRERSRTCPPPVSERQTELFKFKHIFCNAIGAIRSPRRIGPRFLG